MNREIVIGTRGSKLALLQAELAKKTLLLHHEALAIEVKVIKTLGDKILNSPLSRIDDKGLFVKEIEIALLEGEIDIGVHSYKDLPVEQPSGLRVAGVLEREAVEDAFISNKYSLLSDVSPQCKIGTSSLRRKSQLLSLRPDILVEDIRGNLETRLKKLDRGDYDALVVAVAGLKRLGFSNRITTVFSVDEMVPAVGQGALALETREDDEEINELSSFADHLKTGNAVKEEREFLAETGGGCRVPVGCYARFEDDSFLITGFIGDLEGKKKYSTSWIMKKEEFRGSGKRLAEYLLSQGGKSILEKIRS
ncbi:MAG: hydroxymethylbilane synthase [Acidobacteriota bacterium]